MAICTYIGLGSNLEDPIDQVQRALSELAQLPDSELRAHSRLYRSDPVGPPGQPDYINAVAELHTELAVESLLDLLQQLEQSHRRKRLVHWGPRTLDLDILLYGNQQIATERLSVPHP
ncbi:MAG TPA: 2-amino-4-hydroxy-6-hydroxymethyldihydropteridine diphosphokinase, partial [Motiliproteus sp.]